MDDTPLTPSQFVALANQVLDGAFPLVTIEGELSEFRISRDRWLFFKLKDEEAVVEFFGTVFQLKHPLEDGMMVRVAGRPRLSAKWGFSVNVELITPTGEGAIRRAYELLKAKLAAEGLFDPAKKRPLSDLPETIGLISSEAAAGATDFLTILNERWGGIKVLFTPVQVQGEAAPEQIAGAIDYFNGLSQPVDTLVLVRGGGSLEDLLPFNSELVARAVAASRSPIVVGVGHEDDVSLADLAADARAATPTHAAGLVVPDKRAMSADLDLKRGRLHGHIQNLLIARSERYRNRLQEAMNRALERLQQTVQAYRRSLAAYDPKAALRRGYSVLSKDGRVLTSVRGVAAGDTIEAELSDGRLSAEVKDAKS